MGRLAIVFVVAVIAIGNIKERRLSADIISTTLFGDAYAEFDGTFDADSSTSPNQSLSALHTKRNSYSESLLQWAWNGGVLSGSTQITLEKTADPELGGAHVGQTYLRFDFEVDSNTPYSISGDWGTINQFGIEDFVGWRLLDSTMSQIDGAALSTPNLGLAAENFSSSGVLSPDSYTLIFESNLFESHFVTGISQSGWTLNNFTIGVAVPEPNTALLGSVFGSLIFAARRRRR